MTTTRVKVALGRALPVLLVVAAVGIGATMRVRYLRHELMSRWYGALEGGALTTQATVDEWFADRKADADALAASVAIHAEFPRAGDSSPPFSTVLAPVVRRGKFTDVWVVDAAGRVIAQSARDSLRLEERDAMREALATQKTSHSAVAVLGPHAATFAIVAPVHLAAGALVGAGSPAVVVLRADIVKAFGPWAAGRPNAAMSAFSTPAPGDIVLINACPEQGIPVCIQRITNLSPSSPAALALARKDTFGLFTGLDGSQVLALTRFDDTLGWGVVRRVDYGDALVPYNSELAIEAAFLFALVALLAVGSYAANRTVRVRRLDAQHEATVRLSTVVDASTDGIISLDHAFAITMVNDAVERMLGYSKADLIGRPVFMLFATEWHDHLHATLRDFAESAGAHAPLEATERCIALSANGVLMPVDARVGRAIVNAAPVYVMGLRDVSERARTENFLKGQRHVLEMIARGAPAADTLDALLSVVHAEATELRCAIYELDAERQVARLVSSEDFPAGIALAIREFGVNATAEAVGMAIHHDEAVLTSDIEHDPLWSVTGRLLVANGIRAAWTIPLRSADRNVIGVLACFFDTAREPSAREHELAGAAVHLASIALSSARDAASLRLSEASFRSFVENTPAAIFRETRSGELESTNRAMSALLGYESAAALQHAAASGRLYAHPDARARLVRTLESDGVAQGVELEWQCENGSRVRVRVSARAYRDELGNVSLWEGYAENVTSLRLAEKALRRSEKLAAVGQLISGVAHELNNPLSSIMHFTEDLLADERPAEDAEALGVIRDQARRSRAIVRDLLSFVRQREATTLPMSLMEVVAATVRALAPALAEGGVSVHITDDSQQALVLADRAGIEQIVTNIVSNAVQASGKGGSVRVRTQCGGGECELVIEDSGAGIPDDVLPRIFDPFFTTKGTGEGTGLGLSVTLGIVEQFGGRIAVEPRIEGSGARFIVSFPRIHEEAVVAPTIAVQVPLPQSGEDVAKPIVAAAKQADTQRLALIIDDEPTIRSALRRYFTRRGWSVEEAEDGRAGLARIDELGGRISVVISDLRMPGFSGIDLHDRLAIASPALLRRFVFSTGDVASVEAASFVQRTLCPVLQKPFELRMLDEIIAGVMDGADGERVVA